MLEEMGNIIKTAATDGTKLANQFWLTCIQTQTTLFKYEPEYFWKTAKR
jgi:hypothetical protein